MDHKNIIRKYPDIIAEAENYKHRGEHSLAARSYAEAVHFSEDGGAPQGQLLLLAALECYSAGEIDESRFYAQCGLSLAGDKGLEQNLSFMVSLADERIKDKKRPAIMDLRSLVSLDCLVG
ncbi:hypothetical protein COV93_06650 [Candidatus Woesearchaeota archaeon CG11_big_fil_rev_8_21_14_0_20_43_8]|nr:MAG: hypothetical protein COV93_06650 [Candidatus Woesearchaeota archaeon CG11_big_fil_rev_8_21_14_0_20_43_8]